MQTLVDIDEAVLREAEAKARQEGKSLALLMEESLRHTLHTAAKANLSPANPALTEGLDDDDAFFVALEAIRDHGRLSAAHRLVKLS